MIKNQNDLPTGKAQKEEDEDIDLRFIDKEAQNMQLRKKVSLGRGPTRISSDSRRSGTSKLHKTGLSKQKSMNIEEVPDKLLDLMGVGQGSARKHARISIVYDDRPGSGKHQTHSHSRFRKSVNISNGSGSVRQNRVINESINSYRAKKTFGSDSVKDAYGKTDTLPIRKESLFASSPRSFVSRNDPGSNRHAWSHLKVHKDKKYQTGGVGSKSPNGSSSRETGKDKASGFKSISTEKKVPTVEKIASGYTFKGQRHHGVKIKVIFRFLKFLG